MRKVIFESEALFDLTRDCVLEKRGEVASRLIKHGDKDWIDTVLKVYDECLDILDSSIKEE